MDKQPDTEVNHQKKKNPTTLKVPTSLCVRRQEIWFIFVLLARQTCDVRLTPAQLCLTLTSQRLYSGGKKRRDNETEYESIQKLEQGASLSHLQRPDQRPNGFLLHPPPLTPTQPPVCRLSHLRHTYLFLHRFVYHQGHTKKEKKNCPNTFLSGWKANELLHRRQSRTFFENQRIFSRRLVQTCPLCWNVRPDCRLISEREKHSQSSWRNSRAAASS